MKKKVVSSVRKLLFAGYYIVSLMIVPIVYNRSFKHGELSYLSKNDFEIWKKSMLKMLKEYCVAGYNFRIRQVIYTFANSKVEVIRKTEVKTENIPIVVLCIKNDLRRIRILVEHYRALGVEKFAFMDNGSDDGTFEWLLKQPDIDLFRCFEHYQTAVKEGWINRIVSHYGFNRWYILTDSDELGTYIGMEQHSLRDVIKYAEQYGIKRFKGLTIDMYVDGQPFGNTDDIRGDYRFMDVDTYFEKEVTVGKYKYKAYLGGPRHRLMNSNITLSKFPLVYFEKGMVSDSAHVQFPHSLLSQYQCYIGILHYKFIDKDFEVYRKRAQTKSGFSTGGLMYKEYMNFIEKTEGINFVYKDSIEFNNSDSLKRISFICEMRFSQ